MKKLISILFCAACISVNAIAQSGVRIGNLEFIVKKTERDSITQVFTEEDPCPPCPPENNIQPKPKPKFNSFHDSRFFAGAGAIFPDNGSNYYTVLAGTSFNIDAGWIHCYKLSRWFALGGTTQYSFYNYKLRDAVNEPKFAEEIIGTDFADDEIRKQVYRSHNFAASVFTRFYFVPLQVRNGRIISGSGMFIDLGVQGDFTPYKFCMLNTESEGKKRYHDDYAFNAFTASAYARLALSNDWAIFVRYRLTEAFNPKVLPLDLPPLTIGIQLSSW